MGAPTLCAVPVHENDKMKACQCKESDWNPVLRFLQHSFLIKCATQVPKSGVTEWTIIIHLMDEMRSTELVNILDKTIAVRPLDSIDLLFVVTVGKALVLIIK